MLTRVILETLVVEFDGNLYLQIRGTAMGTNCAPQLANIFGFWLEHLALGNAPPGWILYLYCYIEDVFLAVRNQEAARWVLNHLNGVTPMIVYSGEVSERSVAYLDLCISTGKNFLGTGVLETSTYCKPSSQMKYYPIPPSYHYPPTFKGWIKAEFFRLIRNCSSKESLLKDKFVFLENLLRRGINPPWLFSLFKTYTFEMRDEILARHKYKRNSKLVKKRGEIPFFFKTTFNPTTKYLNFMDIYRKEIRILPAFLHRRIIAVYKKSKNVRDILITNSKF